MTGTLPWTIPADLPTYDTYEKAAAAQRARQREAGLFSGIIRVGDVWALRCDITWSGR